MGGALGVLGVGYAGRSQRRMRRVNRSAARLSRGGIGDLRVECVKEVSGRVSFSIWGAGAPWERPPTDYLNYMRIHEFLNRRRVISQFYSLRLEASGRVLSLLDCARHAGSAITRLPRRASSATASPSAGTRRRR